LVDVIIAVKLKELILAQIVSEKVSGFVIGKQSVNLTCEWMLWAFS